MTPPPKFQTNFAFRMWVGLIGRRRTSPPYDPPSPKFQTNLGGHAVLAVRVVFVVLGWPGLVGPFLGWLELLVGPFLGSPWLELRVDLG